jgi:hypothetical protein
MVTPLSIRSFQRSPQGGQPLQRPDSEAVPAQDEWKPRRVTSSRLDAEKLRLEKENLQLAKNLKQSLLARGDQVLAKDSSVNFSHLVMTHNEEDGLSAQFIAQMGEIGALEGYQVLARCAQEKVANLKEQLKQWPGARHVTVVATPSNQDVWTEDQGEFTLQGDLIIPPLLDTQTPFGQITFLGRLKRLHPEADVAQVASVLTENNLAHAMSTYPKANFSYQGGVGEGQTHLGMLEAGLALDLPQIRMTSSYIEGGNFMPGQRADGTPIAFVGRDSVHISADILENDLGKKVTEGQVLHRIAKDYGFKPNQVVPVEQPADFHIDMAMTWTRPGHLLLNDSRAVLQMQKGWLNDWLRRELEKGAEPESTLRSRYAGELQRLEQMAEHHAELESHSLRDLQQEGVQIDRIAGSFPASLANPAMNFLNLRQGSAEDGTTFAVMLGGTPEAETYIREQLLEKLPTGYQRLHFLDPSLTSGTLDLWGGIKCRTKPLVLA